MPFNLTMSEIAVVLILALIFLGPKKLPELASGLGKMIREIKKVTAGVKDEIQLDENVRKPFEELREALTLPAEELKRRDEWKAEWEKRQQEEAALAAQNPEGSETPNDESSADAHATSDDGHHEHHYGQSHWDEHGHDHGHDHDQAPLPAPVATSSSADQTPKSTVPAAFERTSYAGAMGGAASAGDKTIATAAPSLADKTMISPTPTAPSVPRLPTAPPVGAVASGGRTMMGVSPAGSAARPMARPTPPPPPPAAARLPAPKVAARVVPQPEPPAKANAEASPATPPPEGTTPKA